mgnify:CR=1 FL=1
MNSIAQNLLGENYKTYIVLFLCALIIGIKLGTLIPLLALILEARGYSNTEIGLNVVAQPLAVILFVRITPIIIHKIGLAKSIIIAQIFTIILYFTLPIFDSLTAWFVIRFIIGFAGAPWTLACYMIEGQSSKDFINTRKALWDSNKWFMELIDTLSIYVAEKLEMQAKAGADILMIFDSWSHMIPSNFFRKCAIDPTAKIISMLKSKNVTKPIIGLPFKAGSSLIDYSYESNVNCIALDWTVNLKWAIKNLNSSIAIQGNLDPASLIPFDSSHLENIVLSILNIMKDNRFIFSVGHGLTPDCKIKNVQKVIDIVRNYK